MLVGRRHWRSEDELVAEVRRVLDDTHDGPFDPAERESLTQTDAELRRRAVGEGQLARCRRIPPLPQCEHRCAERQRWILRTNVDLIGGAGHRHRGVTDRLERPELIGQLTSGIGDGAGLRARDDDPVLGLPEGGDLRCRQVERRDGGEGARGDAEGDQRQHQPLLSPVAPHQPPRPAEHGPSRHQLAHR